MATAFRGFFARLFRLRSVGGPIFTKEMRVASRQRRGYVLRSAYLGTLLVYVVLVWLIAVRFDASQGAAYRVSRMPEVGKTITTWIIWFQCVAAQVAAVVLSSTAISEEVDRGTLGVLATTPLTAFQIVSGKLLSRLLQLVMLLAVSFPLLALVRVFGGVPWSFVIAGLSISLSASVFAGAFTMLLSMKFRRAHVTIVLSLLGVVGCYLAVTLVLGMTGLGIFLVPPTGCPMPCWGC